MKKLKIFLITSLLLTTSLFARERRKVEQIGSTEITIVELGEREVEYTVLSKTKDLQRQGQLAFKNQQYTDAESCYSLAMKASPKSRDLLIEYVFCSLLSPVLSSAYSLRRAEMLLVHLESLKPERISRYWIAKALYSRAEGDLVKALESLERSQQIKRTSVATSLIEAFRMNKSLDISLMDKLLPVKLAPREKRSNRN